MKLSKRTTKVFVVVIVSFVVLGLVLAYVPLFFSGY